MTPYHLTDTELYYFNEGISTAAYQSLGCHSCIGTGGETVWRFAVWAPEARAISVVGDFNEWNPKADPMRMVGTTGVWEAHLGFVKPGQYYKYAIITAGGEELMKADPYAVQAERNGTASVVAELPEYNWSDGTYLKARTGKGETPVSIYEVHVGSWKKGLTYRDMARELLPYVEEMGYTHLEFMPLAEYPYNPSWGYQITGYYAPTSRYGTAEDLMYLVDEAHRRGIGVIMDWVPAHFTRDAYGLSRFDGTCLYENPDPAVSDMPQWGTLLFDFERNQVHSFLLSNAVYWLKEFHIDGLRVDAVACMLYRDFGREGTDWVPNRYGGRENLGAALFLKKLSRSVEKLGEGKLLFAEDSSDYSGVTRSVQEGGLGFSYKWNMGWMNDVLSYMEMDPFFRRWHHDKLNFSMCYAFGERYVLPLSHDEVVCGKRSLLSKMPGSYDDQFAQLRLLFAFQFAHPGKKLMFMGDEFGQYIEWRFDASLDWMLLDYEKHRGVQTMVRTLNRLYRGTEALYRIEDSWDGFTWLQADDCNRNVAVWLRRDNDGNSVLCAFNFSPERWEEYAVGVPEKGTYAEIFSTNEGAFGGNVHHRPEFREAEEKPVDGFPCSLRFTLAPYEALYLYHARGNGE